MSPVQLSLEEIQIRRMPGFENGGFPVEGLAAGVNVIYGPNASGKTTLSRAIGRLLSADRSMDEPVCLYGVVERNGQTLAIEYDYGQVRCQQDGMPLDAVPRLAPPEVEQHCILALHDLIQSTDGADLAAEIVRRTAGGYDVAEAREAIGFRQKPRNRGKLNSSLDAACRRLRETRGEQEALVRCQQQLDDLRRKKDEARSAQQRLDHLHQWQSVLKANGEVQQAKEKLDAYPRAMNEVVGDEVDRLKSVRQDLTNALERRSESAKQREVAERTLAESTLPAEGVPQEEVSALRKQCTRLRELRNKLEERQIDKSAAETRVRSAATKLGAGVTLDHVKHIDDHTINQLFALARRAGGARAQKSASETLQQWLGDSRQQNDANTISDGVQLLEKWLAADAEHDWARKVSVVAWIVAGAFVLVLSSIISLAVHLSALLFLPVGLGLVAWPFVAPLLPLWQQKATAEIEQDYTSLGIPAPPQWADAPVRSLARQLRQNYAEAVVEEEKATRWADLSNEVERAREESRNVEQERHGWCEKLGVEVNVDAEELALLASNLAELSKAQAELTSAGAKVTRREHLFARRGEQLRVELSAFGLMHGEDPESFEAQVEQLSQRREKHDKARDTVERCNRELTQIDKDIETTNEKVRTLFAKVGLTPDDEPKLHELVKLRTDYLDAASELKNAQSDLRAAKAACRADDSIKTIRPAEIEEEIAKADETASGFDELQTEIIGIEAKIELAKKASNVEQALSNKEELEDQLRQQRDEDCAAIVGHLLSEHIATQQREREQPRVLRRAGELFVRFTHGRYKLLVDASDPPAFRAIDTARNVGQALNELSGGTRLQLLLAVHVAFVEEHEGQYQLPLMLDEALGNSDERRAREIIDAAVEICRGGRQVFYFTAQHDEVGKWRSILRNCDDIPYKEIDLADVRQFSAEERIVPLELESPEPIQIPQPGDADWLQYGRMLEVPPIVPSMDIGSVPLWYVVHHPADLYRLLKNGVNLWGQLKTLVESHPPRGFEASSPAYNRAAAAADVIEATCRLYAVGRGKRVDRQVLLDSGAVSLNFIDKVSKWCNDVQGNASSLIDALNEGKIRGFRNDKKQELVEYFRSNGFLDERDVLDHNEIMRLVQPVAFRHVEHGLIDLARIEQLVHSVLASETATANS